MVRSVWNPESRLATLQWLNVVCSDSEYSVMSHDSKATCECDQLFRLAIIGSAFSLAQAKSSFTTSSQVISYLESRIPFGNAVLGQWKTRYQWGAPRFSMIDSWPCNYSACPRNHGVDISFSKRMTSYLDSPVCMCVECTAVPSLFA